MLDRLSVGYESWTNPGACTLSRVVCVVFGFFFLLKFCKKNNLNLNGKISQAGGGFTALSGLGGDGLSRPISI